MSIHSTINVGTLNWLAPKAAVYWSTQAGLTEEAKKLSFDQLHEIGETDQWELYSNWPERQKELMSCIQKAGVDVLCSQEVTPPAIDDLANNKSFNPLYQKDLFQADHPEEKDPYEQDGPALYSKQNSGLKLIDTQVIESIRVVDNKPLRRVAMSALYETAEKIRVRVTSVHLTGFNPFTQATNENLKPGMDELKNYLNAINRLEKADVDIIAGDFNQDPNKSIEVVRGYDRCALLEDLGFKTLTNAHPTEPDLPLKRRIDHLYVRSNNPETKIELENLNTETLPSGSDHRMVALKVHVTKNALLHALSTIKRVLAIPF